MASESVAGSPHLQSSGRIQAFSQMVDEIGCMNDTEQALVSHVKVEQEAACKARQENERWQRWWRGATLVESDSNEDLNLLEQCKQVTDIWRGFSMNPSGKRILRKANVTITDDFNPPSIDTLHQAIQSLAKERDKSAATLWGKTRANLLAFANTMNAHKALLSIFPSENIYTSVLSGVISTIVLASANHKRAAEGFFKGFKEIGDNLAYLSESKKSLETPQSRKALANAYVEVFRFLCFALKWLSSRWSRLSSSVQATFYDDHIKSYIDEIERLSRIVDRELGLRTHDGVLDLLDIGQALQSPEQKRSVASRFRRQDDVEVGHGFENASRAFAELGFDIIRCLDATEQQHDYDVLMLAVRKLPTPRRESLEEEPRRQIVHTDPSAGISESDVETSDSGSNDDDEAANEEESAVLHHYSLAQIEELVVTPLQAFLANGIAEAIETTQQDSSTLIPPEVLNAIQEWLAIGTSSLLWVEGPVFPSDLTPAALRVCSVLVSEGIPCIPFFDHRRYHNPWKLDKSQAGVICLLYTLIHELVSQLPSVVHSEIVLDQPYFAALDGSWESTKHALNVIRVFMTHTSSSIVFVINGLEAIDDKGTRNVLKELIDIIREHSSRAIVKTLFVTNGMSQALGYKTSRKERVDASRLRQDGPGRTLRGGSSLSELHIDHLHNRASSSS